MKEGGAKPKWDVKDNQTSAAAAAPASMGSPLDSTFATLQSMLSTDIVSSIGAVYTFDLKGLSVVGLKQVNHAKPG